MNIKTIQLVTSGKLSGACDENADVRHLLFDSRQLMSSEGVLFIAIKTGKNDGHGYIEDLYGKGVRHFLVEHDINIKKFPLGNFIVVNNSISALQKIAKYHRSLFNVSTIGITGSNGKTIVKEWLYQLLREDHNIVRSPQSYNSQLGVPMSVWRLNSEHDLAIFEAGLSKTGEMRDIAPIIDCGIGLFTSLGTAHDAGFADMEEKVREKCLLFKNAHTVYYRKDIPHLHEEVSKLHSTGITWSFDKDSDFFINEIKENKQTDSGLVIKGIYKGGEVAFRIPFEDEMSRDNAILCALVMLGMGYEAAEIDHRMQGISPVAMRLELKRGIHQSTLINDTYNLDFSSLQSSLRFMRSQAGDKPQTLILSDILEHSTSVVRLYHTIARWLKVDFDIHKIIGIGEEVKVLEGLLDNSIQKYFYGTTNDFINDIQNIQFGDEIILIKGARKFRFERIVARLEQQLHRTVLEINFNALRHNLNVYRQTLKPDTRLMVMVKASAYGAGSAEVAKLMESEKVDYLTVAYIDEGVELRKEGVRIPILVLNPEPSGFGAMLRHGLEPEIYSLAQLRRFHTFILEEGKSCPIHIKLDTGMRRLGFEERHISALIRYLGESKIPVRSIFSHLAGSDAAEHDDFTRRQVIRYERMYKRLSNALGTQPLRHILNSAGISRFPDYQFDMVRLGIGLYGVATDAKIRKQLRVISTLKARVSQIKELKPGESVGYNRGGKVYRPTRIATVGIGYADGLPRAAGYGKFSLLLRGKRAKTIGVICMDMCMIDISHIPGARVGDEVTIFGESPRIEELADCMGTIPYEVLTSVSKRVKRVYVLD